MSEADETLTRVNQNLLSIDRVDSEGGYTRDNVALVTPFVNIIKWDISHTDFMNIVKLIYENSSDIQNSNRIFLPEKFFNKRPVKKSKIIYPKN